MKKLYLVCFILTVITLSSCSDRAARTDNSQGDTIKLSYAKLINIIEQDDYTEVMIDNPWRKGNLLHKYLLVDRNKPQPAHLPKGTVVRVPLQRSVVFTTAHASLIEMFGATDEIAGVADLKYMLLPDIHKRIADNKMFDCGDAMAPNIEKIIEIEADGILLSPFDNSGGYGRLEDIGIPIIECADYMELSALGRAEWMKFYGLLYGKSDEATRLFDTVREAYDKLKKTASTSTQRLSILTERMTGSTWYIAGGQSSIGQIIADAGGKYAFANDNHSGSIALPFETVLDRFGDADVWIFNHYAEKPITYKQLSAEHHGYTSLKAFKNRNAFFVNTSRVPYFEEVSFRPDYLLREYIILLHPDLQNKLGKLKYYQKVVDGEL